MSDINQLRYELQALVARYPDLQIDLSQIRVVQSISLMQPVAFSPPLPTQYQPPGYYSASPQPPSIVRSPQPATQIFAQPEGVSLVPPQPIVPTNLGSMPINTKGTESLEDVAAKAVRASLSRKIKPV